MFSFIGMPAFVIALKMANMLHLIAAVVLWVSWAVPIGVVLPIWYSENHINSLSAAWMVPIILIPLLGTAIAVAIHIVFKKRGGGGGTTRSQKPGVAKSELKGMGDSNSEMKVDVKVEAKVGTPIW